MSGLPIGRLFTSESLASRRSNLRWGTSNRVSSPAVASPPTQAQLASDRRTVTVCVLYLWESCKPKIKLKTGTSKRASFPAVASPPPQAQLFSYTLHPSFSYTLHTHQGFQGTWRFAPCNIRRRPMRVPRYPSTLLSYAWFLGRFRGGKCKQKKPFFWHHLFWFANFSLGSTIRNVVNGGFPDFCPPPPVRRLPTASSSNSTDHLWPSLNTVINVARHRHKRRSTQS